MNEVKEKFLRYTVSEWITLLTGIVIAYFQINKYRIETLGSSAIEIVVLAVWMLLIINPKTITSLIRKARGLEEKKE